MKIRIFLKIFESIAKPVWGPRAGIMFLLWGRWEKVKYVRGRRKGWLAGNPKCQVEKFAKLHIPENSQSYEIPKFARAGRPA